METDLGLQGRASPRSLVAAAFRPYVAALGILWLVSGMINLLALTGAFFMLQVYDRVLPSGSLPTLLALGVLMVVLYTGQGGLDILRGRTLGRIGAGVDRALSPRVHDAVLRLPLMSRAVGDGLLPLRDLDAVRGFVSGPGPSAFFDLPWMPVYLGICFLFHPWIGMAALGGAIVLSVLALTANLLTRAPTTEAARQGSVRNARMEAARRNAEAVHAMGFGPALAARWRRVNARFLQAQRRGGDVAGGLGGVSRALRMILQSSVLGVGAWLVIEQEASAGVMIASSIMLGRALAPVDAAITQWGAVLAARQSWHRLDDLLSALPESKATLHLPAPVADVRVEAVSVVPPGQAAPVLRDLSFALRAGSALGVIGPSAAGKSSLARVLVGVWGPARGAVRLDGAALDQWEPAALGRHLGYLPQDVELFDGTVAENIARFNPEASAEDIVAAGRAAGSHDMIVRLPDGYDTPIGEGGSVLSAGQRQRVGLARALYGDPFLVVLDEPNANLDGEGEAALAEAIDRVRARGGIAVIVSHRASALAAVDRVLALEAGRARAFGPRDQVLSRLARGEGERPAGPLRVVAAADEEEDTP